MEKNEKQTTQPEVWMRGPVAGVPAMLQPVAHALLQSKEEIQSMMEKFPDNMLWQRPADVASPAFHLQHIPGVLDRLFTYAKGGQLDNLQLKYLSEEGLENGSLTTRGLVSFLAESIDRAVEQLRNTDPSTLAEERGVGRKKLPSTVLGLFFHAAEHTMRHTGQLLVTVRVLNDNT